MFEVDCRFDNRECVVIYRRWAWLRRLFRLRTNPTCRHGVELDPKMNEYCKDRLRPRTK